LGQLSANVDEAVSRQSNQTIVRGMLILSNGKVGGSV
jgi:hypothetical protein